MTTPTSRLGIPHFDQKPFSPSTNGDDSTIETQSHVPTHLESSRPDEGETQQGSSSFYSYVSSRDVSRFVREIYGRTFNNLNDAYPFPSDDIEWQRLDKVHSVFTVVFGALYPASSVVEAILAPVGDLPKRVLDLGCGTGSWALEMATLFPHAEVRGVDLAPTPIDVSTYPPNLHFEIDDVNHGLEHFYGLMDVVQARSMLAGCTDSIKTIREMLLCLKPGGILLLIDGDKHFFDENDRAVKLARVEGDENVDGISDEGSFFQRIIWEALEASKMVGSDHDPGINLIDHGLWDEPLCDPETAGVGSFLLPLGPWAHSDIQAEDEALRYAGVLIRQVFFKSIRGFHKILRQHGMPQATLDNWTRQADEELNTMNPRMWCRYRFCWARRRAGPGLPAPPLPHADAAPSPPVSSTLTSPNSQLRADTPPSYRYPALDIYNTPQEALLAKERRHNTIGTYPTPAVKRAVQAL